MNDKKYIVPEGMLQVARSSWGSTLPEPMTKAILEAALRWQDGELEKMYDRENRPFGSSSEAEVNRFSNIRHGKLSAIEEVRRMFLAPETKGPKEIDDLLLKEKRDDSDWDTCVRANIAIVEAFRRGQENPK